MTVVNFLRALDRLSNHGEHFVLDDDIIPELSKKSVYRNRNRRRKIRAYFEANGLIISLDNPVRINITYLGLDAMNNSVYGQWLDQNKDFSLIVPSLSLMLVEREHAQPLDFLFRNTTGFDIWATTAQNFLGYLYTIFTGQNRLVTYNGQKIRILVFDIKGFFEQFGKPVKNNQLPDVLNLIKSVNLPIDKLQEDFFTVLPDLISKLRKLVHGTDAEKKIEIRKTCHVKFYSCIFVRNEYETKLSFELYSQYMQGNARIKFQLYKNKTFTEYASVIENNEKEFEDVWTNQSVPF